MRTPRKNISSTLHDIRPPEGFFPRRTPSPPPRFESAVKSRPEILTPLWASPNLPNRKKRRPLFAGGIVVVLVALFAYGVYFFELRHTVPHLLYTVYTESHESAERLQKLDAEGAARSVAEAERAFLDVEQSVSRFGLRGLRAFLGSILPTFQHINGALTGLKDFFGEAGSAGAKLQELTNEGFVYFMEGEGEKFITLLTSLRASVATLTHTGVALAEHATALDSAFFAKYIGAPLAPDISVFATGYATEEFLDALLALFKKERSLHFALLFQNPSEMRPSGGFLGSYAHLTVQGGALRELDVRDIYDPDGWVFDKKIPPVPLQVTTVDWEARDANWFFDFALSAEKVIDRLEASQFYRDRGVWFDGAIAINTTVIESLLEFTGPIPLPAYDLIVTHENFLEEVQYEVEAGESKAQGAPKKILQDLTPLLLSRLSALSGETKSALLARLGEHAKTKDVQLYFKEPRLERFMEHYGLAGDVYEFSRGEAVDYLAVVNANVAGGKTDAYITQQTNIRSRIDFEGTVHNTVAVLRAHAGGDTPYAWYNVINKSYVRLLTHPRAKNTEIAGATERIVRAPIAYKANGYTTDADIVALEEEGKESGKGVFGAWRYTKPKGESEITFQYEVPRLVEPKDGARYQFVFERQSGVQGGVSYMLEAPAGFRFAESKNIEFKYTNENPPARVMLVLTLEAI